MFFVLFLHCCVHDRCDAIITAHADRHLPFYPPQPLVCLLSLPCGARVRVCVCVPATVTWVLDRSGRPSRSSSVCSLSRMPWATASLWPPPLPTRLPSRCVYVKLAMLALAIRTLCPLCAIVKQGVAVLVCLLTATGCCCCCWRCWGVVLGAAAAAVLTPTAVSTSCRLHLYVSRGHRSLKNNLFGIALVSPAVRGQIHFSIGWLLD